jgi:outer membrane protein assembly factor BamD (BamD/ComL family)
MQHKSNTPPLACLAKALKILSMMYFCSGFSVTAETNKPLPKPPKTVSEQARESINASKFAEAESAILKYLQAQPNSPDAAECYFLLGRLQARNQRAEDALRTFSNTFSRYPKSEWSAQALAEQIPIYLQRRNPGAAQKCRDELLRHHPQSPTTARVWTSVADQCFDEQKFKEAAKIYQNFEANLTKEEADKLALANVFSVGNGDPERILPIADLALRQNRVVFARSIYDQISKSSNAQRHISHIRTKLGWCLYLDANKENLEQAESLWRQVVKSVKPSDPWYAEAKWHLVQLASGHQGDWKKAVALCQEIEREQPVGSYPHEQALFSRAWLLTVQEQGQLAVDAFDDLIAAYPEKANQPVIIKHRERALESKAKQKAIP